MQQSADPTEISEVGQWTNSQTDNSVEAKSQNFVELFTF